MPTITYTLSPVPMPPMPPMLPMSPVPMSHMSPIYSQRPPSKTPTSSYRPHIIPRKMDDMIPSPSPIPISLISQDDSLIISFLQGLCIFTIITMVVFVLWTLLFEIARARAKARAKARANKQGGFSLHNEIHIQKINPTAYNKLNLIRRSSSGNLNPV